MFPAVSCFHLIQDSEYEYITWGTSLPGLRFLTCVFLIIHFSLKILARLMTAKFLHTEIREKGGAYGGGARLSRDGVFTLYSYR